MGLQVLEKQTRAALAEIPSSDLGKVMLAYEPTWAIGVAGEPANPSYVNDQHTGIRKVLEDMYSPEIAATIPLLYGGSVNFDNFASYAEVDDVDGLFVGRAAWEPKSFMRLFAMSHKFCGAPHRRDLPLM